MLVEAVSACVPALVLASATTRTSPVGVPALAAERFYEFEKGVVAGLLAPLVGGLAGDDPGR